MYLLEDAEEKVRLDYTRMWCEAESIHSLNLMAIGGEESRITVFIYTCYPFAAPFCVCEIVHDSANKTVFVCLFVLFSFFSDDIVNWIFCLANYVEMEPETRMGILLVPGGPDSCDVLVV